MQKCEIKHAKCHSAIGIESIEYHYEFIKGNVTKYLAASCKDDIVNGQPRLTLRHYENKQTGRTSLFYDNGPDSERRGRNLQVRCWYSA